MQNFLHCIINNLILSMKTKGRLTSIMKKDDHVIVQSDSCSCLHDYFYSVCMCKLKGTVYEIQASIRYST